MSYCFWVVLSGIPFRVRVIKGVQTRAYGLFLVSQDMISSVLVAKTDIDLDIADVEVEAGLHYVSALAPN